MTLTKSDLSKIIRTTENRWEERPLIINQVENLEKIHPKGKYALAS